MCGRGHRAIRLVAQIVATRQRRPHQQCQNAAASGPGVVQCIRAAISESGTMRAESSNSAGHRVRNGSTNARPIRLQRAEGRQYVHIPYTTSAPLSIVSHSYTGIFEYAGRTEYRHFCNSVCSHIITTQIALFFDTIKLKLTESSVFYLSQSSSQIWFENFGRNRIL